MSAKWRQMTALPDFVDCPSSILVWNECNGTSEIIVEPEFVWQAQSGKSPWRFWRAVPEPSAAQKALFP